MTAWREALVRREQVLGAVRTELIDVLQLDRVPDELDPDMALVGTGLSIDSIDMMELVVRLEGRFEVRVADPSTPGAMHTLNTLVDQIVAATG